MAIDSFQGRYRFLSNFYPVKIMWDGIEFPTVEHAYQATKAANRDVRVAISNLSTPVKARLFGRRLHLRGDGNFSEARRVEMMLMLVRKKFHGHPILAQQLLETADVELIEGNEWKDTFWGVWRGKGENNLGRILMQVRKELRDAKS